MGGALYWITYTAALGAILYGGLILAGRFSTVSARLTSRNARRACKALPEEATAAVGFARGFSGDLSRPALLAYAIASYFFVPILIFLRRHPPVELVATAEHVYVVRQRHPLFARSRREVAERLDRSAVNLVQRWRRGASIIDLGDDRYWLMPGHLQALLGGSPGGSVALGD